MVHKYIYIYILRITGVVPSAAALGFFTPDFFYIVICISDLRAMHPWKVGQFCMFVYKCCGTFSPPNIDTIRRIDEFIRYTYSSCIFTNVGLYFFVSMDNIILCDFSHSILYCEIETIDVQMLMNGSNHNTCYNVSESDLVLGWCRVVTIVPQGAHNINQILVLAI